MDHNLHKDTISNGRCVVPLRKECHERRIPRNFTTQMSSQQVVNGNIMMNQQKYCSLRI
jgi:hypothetical protein